MDHPDPAVRSLLALAREAATRAYCPYSGFAVGAALRVPGGGVYVGANVENASYGLTLCAERAAVAAAVGAGHRAVELLVLYTPTPEPVSPCGACRQVLAEFGEGARVLSFCDGPDSREWTLPELLPDSFDLGAGLSRA
jgi:cytidine deaminase